MLGVFKDGIVVTNPGALPNHMTVDQARKGGVPRSRSDMMANALVVNGLIDGCGRGWLTPCHEALQRKGAGPRQPRAQPGSSG